MFLSQLHLPDGTRVVAMRQGEAAHLVPGASGTRELALAAIEAAGTTEVRVPTAEERLAFKKALVPVHRAMAPRIGKDLIEAIYDETGFDPDDL